MKTEFITYGTCSFDQQNWISLQTDKERDEYYNECLIRRFGDYFYPDQPPKFTKYDEWYMDSVIAGSFDNVNRGKSGYKDKGILASEIKGILHEA